MKTFYILTLMALLIVMLILSQRAKKKNDRLAKTLIHLAYSVAITVLASALAMVLPSESVALFMQTMHYASTEWMLIFLIVFFEEYTEAFKGNMIVRIIVFAYSTACSIMLLLNVFFGHVVYIEYRTAQDIEYRMFRTLSPWYEMHEYFAYALAGVALLALIGELFRTTSYYRLKYYPAIIAFLITLGMEGLCKARDSLMDYALFGYVGLAIFLIYHTVYYVNKRLITQTLSHVTTETAGGIVCFDITGRCIYANDVAYMLYSDAKEDGDFEDIFSKYNYGKKRGNNKWTETFEVDGDELYYEISYGRIEDKKGEYIGCFFYMYDRTEDTLSLEEARYQVKHDVLTGLYNEYGFNASVPGTLAEHVGEEMYIVTADMKDFKLINDLFGHEVGDAVLGLMGKCLLNNLPQYVPSCRKRSDHFYFCIRKEDFSEEKLMEWTKPVVDFLEEKNFQLIIHYGICRVGKFDDDIGVMCDYARLAMHRIKNRYDRYFEYFDVSMMDDILRTKDMVRDFDESLKTNQFKMFLQPQVTPGGDVVGAEALVRWNSAEHGMISPGVFIPVFEDVGLIYKLDMYIWEKAVAQLKKWSGTKRDKYYISVNISPKDFQYVDIYDTFVELVERYGIEPNRLKLEITESAFMKDPDKQLEIIEKLQAYGFAVEIDDFGSGYSSLNILKDMKANVLKIDMGFLRKTREIERSKIIIDSIIKMAKSLDMEVISEGVEEKGQIDFMTESGCDIFQGFYYDRPIPVSEFESKY